MSYRHPPARPQYDRGRDYERDRERETGREWRRGSTYRPSEDSRDARRGDGQCSRDGSRDSMNQPPRRVDSNLSTASPGQVTPSGVSLASSPREPLEQTPAKQNSMSNRTEKGLNNPNLNVDIYKGFLDSFKELAMTSSKAESTNKVMNDCDQQQARLEAGMPGTVNESKIWQDKRRRAKYEHEHARKKQRDAEKLCTKNFQKLLQYLMDREKKATPATPSLGQEQEASLLKKLQDTLKEQVTVAILDQNKAMQEALANALADVEKADEERQRPTREYLQKIESEMKEEHSRKVQSLEQTSGAQMDALRQEIRQEIIAFKQQCDEKVRALESQNQELLDAHQKIEECLSEEQAELIRRLESQCQELNAEQEQLKKQLAEDKVEYSRHIDSYKEELATLKQQMAVTHANSAAATMAPAAEIRSLQSELNTVVADVASLSGRVYSMENNDKTTTLESGQHHDQQQQHKEAISVLEKKVGGVQDDVKDLYKNLVNIRERNGDRGSLSVEPKPPRDSPIVDRHSQAQTVTQGTRGITKKMLKNYQLQQTVDIKKWTTEVLEPYRIDAEGMKARNETLEARLTSVQAECSDLQKRVQNIAATAGKVGDATLYAQCSEARDKVNDLELKLEEEILFTSKRAEEWDQRISTLHDHQNSWKSNELASWMIQQIQIHTPNMLLHAFHGVSGRVDNIEHRLSTVEQRADPDANKRRKVTTGHVVANNQQAFNHNNNKNQMSNNSHPNVLVGWPSQTTSQPPNGHQQSPPQYAYQNSPQMNGHPQNQPANGQQQAQPQYAQQR